jgi:hypothetical protein
MTPTERARAIRKLEIAIDKVIDARILGADWHACERLLDSLNSLLNSLRN